MNSSQNSLTVRAGLDESCFVILQYFHQVLSQLNRCTLKKKVSASLGQTRLRVTLIECESGTDSPTCGRLVTINRSLAKPRD